MKKLVYIWYISVGGFV